MKGIAGMIVFILGAVVAGGFAANELGLVKFQMFSIYPSTDQNPPTPEGMFPAVTVAYTKTVTSGTILNQYIQCPSGFAQCSVRVRLRPTAYSGNVYYKDDLTVESCPANIDTRLFSSRYTTTASPIIIPASGSTTISSGSYARMCGVTAGSAQTLESIMYFTAYLPKCGKDPTTLQHMEPTQTTLYDGQYNLCTGERCTRCPAGFDYCYVKCGTQFEGVIPTGYQAVLDKSLSSCSAGNTYKIEGWTCPAVSNPIPVEECGDGILQSSLGEECEYPNTNGNQYCSQSTTSECQGKLYGTKSLLGSCDAVCLCRATAFNYRCEEGKCGASCTTGQSTPCTTADGIPGVFNCLSTCELSNDCVATGVCAPNTKRCNGNFAETCSPSGTSWIRDPVACTYGCTAGVCDKICGDGSVNMPGEVCERPNTNNNQYCTQSTTECSGFKKGVRDSYGFCSSACTCSLDDFTYSCMKGTCGAACSNGEVDKTCTVSGVPGERACKSDCTWGDCSKTGVCVPGTTQTCGNCGRQTCSTAGAWGSCLNVGGCGDGYECNEQ